MTHDASACAPTGASCNDDVRPRVMQNSNVFTDCAVHSAKTTTDSTNATMISTADLDCQQTPHRLVASSSLEASNAQVVAVAQAAGYAAPAAEDPASAADAATCLHTARPSGGDASPVA